MGDFLEHVARGQPIAPTLKADTWNLILDTVRRERLRWLPGATGGQPRGWDLRPTTTCLITNNSGSNLPAFSVLSLSGVQGYPSTNPFPFRDRPVFAGIVPATNGDNIAILQESVPNGFIALAALLGVSICNLLLVNSTDRWATPLAGDSSKLISSCSPGPATILWTGTLTGRVCTAVVLLTGTPADSAIDNWNATSEQARGHNSGGCPTWLDISTDCGSGSGSSGSGGSGGGGIDTPCCSNVPSTLTATCSGGQTVTLTYIGDRTWAGTDGENTWTLVCSGTVPSGWNLEISTGGMDYDPSGPESAQCSPFSQTWTSVHPSFGPNYGTVVIA